MLILCEYNVVILENYSFDRFTQHEIKQCIVFWQTLVISKIKIPSTFKKLHMV